MSKFVITQEELDILEDMRRSLCEIDNPPWQASRAAMRLWDITNEKRESLEELEPCSRKALEE